MGTLKELEKLLEKAKDVQKRTEPSTGGITGKVKVDNLDQSVLDLINGYKIVRLEMPNVPVFDVPQAATVPIFMKIVDDLKLGNNVYLYGAAGTGKTTLAQEIAWTLKGIPVSERKNYEPPYEIVNINQWTSPMELIGGQTIEGYAEGKLVKAWKEGKMLILDELPKGDPNTMGVLNAALAEASKPADQAVIQSGEGKMYRKNPDFCVIGAGNTTMKGTSGQYAGNNKQDASLIDRFSGNFYEVGFNEVLEKSLTYKDVFSICSKIRSELLKLEAEDIMTLRTMIHFNKVYQLEMMRLTGKIPAVEGGKTFKDSLDSYFGIMSPDKATQIKRAINYDMLMRDYRKTDNLKLFVNELTERNKA